MPKIIELKDVIEYPPTLLEKDKNGLYSYPTMRCGVLPYYRQGNQIIWGCVKSNRVGPKQLQHLQTCSKSSARARCLFSQQIALMKELHTLIFGDY